MGELARRRWCLAPLRDDRVGEAPVRNTATADDARLADLLRGAYVDTIDFDPDADPVAELRTWREVDEADDDASFLVELDGEIVAAALIGRELGTPFLYEVVVDADHRERGLARAVLGHSIGALHRRGEEMLSAWVTEGNLASERLLVGLGFVTDTPPLVATQAIGHYRTAALARSIDRSMTRAMGTSIEPDGPKLWVITDRHVGVEGNVEVVAPDDPVIPELADRLLPIHGAAWLFEQGR